MYKKKKKKVEMEIGFIHSNEKWDEYQIYTFWKRKDIEKME